MKLTLDATLEAVRDTSEATEAMRDANTIAREALESQTRPWLKLAVEVFDSQNQGTVVSASITAHTINLGNAPANFVSLVPVILDGEWSTPRILNAVPTLFDDIIKGSDPQNRDINLHDRILFQQDEWAYRCDVKTTDFPEECRTGCLIVSLRYSAAGYIKPRYTTLVFDMIWSRDEFLLSEGESTEYVTFRERGCFSAYAD